jgi:hypothetical protein
LSEASPLQMTHSLSRRAVGKLVGAEGRAWHVAGIAQGVGDVWSYLDGINCNRELDVLIVLWQFALCNC